MIPATVEYGVGLSDEVKSAVPEAVAEVVSELERLGHAPVLKEPPEKPEIWWEREP